MASVNCAFLAFLLVKCLTAEAFLYDSEAELTLFKADGDRTDILGDDCGAGVYFTTPHSYACACITGVWAFYKNWCSEPASIVAGSVYCFKLETGPLKQVTLLSAVPFPFESKLVRMSAGKEQLLEKHIKNATVNWDPKNSSFITIGDSTWELETAGEKSYCLNHTHLRNEVCYYSGFDAKSIRKIKRNCSLASKIIKPDKCAPVQLGNKDEFDCFKEDKDNNTSLEEESYTIRTQIRLKRGINDRTKRQAEPTTVAPGGSDPTDATAATGGSDAGDASGDPAAAPGGSEDGPMEDEDYIEPAQASVKNNPIIMDQLKNYLDGSINDVTGTSPYSTDSRFPAFNLLDKTMQVMQTACNIVSAEHFKLALNVFINIQTHQYHVKEPYMSQFAYKRINDALSDCIMTATPYHFVYDNDTTDGEIPSPSNCAGEIDFNQTNAIVYDGLILNISLPEESKGDGYAPVIETVWKFFLHAHNYCYRKFSEYYNDHHTFTVNLLNFFTNDIQTMWFPTDKNGTYEEPAGSGYLYGGLIGDHRKLMKGIDLCVAASRVGSPYPWLMSRPPRDESNKWARRRKRSTMVSHGQVCLSSAEDVYRKVKLKRCE